MLARIDRGWRTFATGASFAGFGLCGFIFSVLLFPVFLLWRHHRSRRRAVTAIVHLFFRALTGMLQRIGVMTLEVAGVEGLRKGLHEGGPKIIVANHPTYLDVMVLLSLIPSACCVVKSAHWGNPCFWGIVRAAGYVSNADPLELVEAGSRQLEAGYSMIVFPEGTRSPARDRLHRFSRGFAHMALRNGTPIVPVLIDCDPPVFTKRLRWYHVPERPFHMRIAVLDALVPDRWAQADTPPALAARAVTHGIETHIRQRLFAYGFFKT